MTQEEQINSLRDALSVARPFVANVAEAEKGDVWGLRAKHVLTAVDLALVETDPDPAVQAILNRQQ